MMQSNSTKIIWFCALVVLTLVSALVFLPHFLTSLTLSFLLSYILDPAVEWLERKKINRAWGAILILFIFFLLLSVLAILVVPQIFSQGQDLFRRIPIFYNKILSILSELSQKHLGYNAFEDMGRLFSEHNESSELIKPIGQFIQQVFTTTFKTTFRWITGILGLLIIPLLSFYLMRDYPKISRDFRKLIARKKYDLYDELLAKIDHVLGGFIRGQLFVSTVLSVYYSVAFLFAGLEMALILGFLAGFLNLIPYLGIISVMALSFLSAMVQGIGSGKFIAIACIFSFGMAVEGSFLTPKIVGKKVGLSPLMLILALLAGGELFGLVGMLVAVPTVAILKVFIDVGMKRLES